MRAFLSHSSRDAEFVTAVAHELGRQYTWLDRQQFATGDEFLDGIERGLRDSGVFVLFASRAALDSVFVAFEMAEARQQVVLRSLDRVMVFLLEPSLSFRDLPVWLQRVQATPATAPKPVARAIRQVLGEVARSRQKTLFVGRSRDISAIEAQLFPSDGTGAPRLMFLAGLPGVGRRTLVERLARDHWSFQRIIQMRVESGDTLTDVALKFADLYEPHNTAEGLRRIAVDIARETREDVLTRFERYIRTAIGLQELPLFVDAGGLFGNEGEPSELLLSLIDMLRLRTDLYAAAISNRRPQLQGRASHTPAAHGVVHALGGTETKQLLSALANREQLVLGGVSRA